AQVRIQGDGVMKNGILCFDNPQITKGDYYPTCKILSFDIETGKDGRLLSLAYSFRSKDINEDRTMVLGKGVDTEDVFFTPRETGILDFFQAAVKRLDPDIFTGWNVIG